MSTGPKADEEPLQHRPHYDVREASKNYSNIASVLAGFAFAAVVLVVQSVLPKDRLNAIALRDLASIAFLIAFFGCIVSAFIFSVVAGEEVLAPRSHSMAFLGGSGFALSAIYIFWGLSTLIKIFLSPEVISTAYLILGGFVLLCPIFLIMSWFDVSISFDNIEQRRIQIPRQKWITLIMMGYAPLLVGIITRIFTTQVLNDFIPIIYNVVFFSSFVLMLFGAIWSLMFSNTEYRDRINLTVGSVWIGIHSCIFAFLIALLP